MEGNRAEGIFLWNGLTQGDIQQSSLEIHLKFLSYIDVNNRF